MHQKIKISSGSTTLILCVCVCGGGGGGGGGGEGRHCACLLGTSFALLCVFTCSLVILSLCAPKTHVGPWTVPQASTYSKVDNSAKFLKV